MKIRYLLHTTPFIDDDGILDCKRTLREGLREFRKEQEHGFGWLWLDFELKIGRLTLTYTLKEVNLS